MSLQNPVLFPYAFLLFFCRQCPHNPGIWTALANECLFHPKPACFIAPDGPGIILINNQAHALHLQYAKSLLQYTFYGECSKPPAPHFRLQHHPGQNCVRSVLLNLIQFSKTYDSFLKDHPIKKHSFSRGIALFHLGQIRRIIIHKICSPQTKFFIRLLFAQLIQKLYIFAFCCFHIQHTQC